MTVAAVASSPEARRPAPRFVVAARPQPRISGVFQLLLALYVLLIGAAPQIFQALAFGLAGGAGSEFALAMVTSIARDALIVGAVIALSYHPLGILHPLLLAVVVWPLLIAVPGVIEDYGGWAGVLAGLPVQTPYFIGLPSHSASMVWIAIAKYNGLQAIALAATFFGFWVFKGNGGVGRSARPVPSSAAVRSILMGLIGVSLLVLAIFVHERGGLSAHLTSLGSGRFRELADVGVIMVLTDLGTVALAVWLASRPNDVKSPIFLAASVAVIFAQFASNASRSSALEVPLLLGIIWAIRTRRIPWRIALLLVPVMFVSFGLLGAVRTSSWTGSNATEALTNTSWSESLARAEAEIEDRHSLNAQIPVVDRGFEVTGGPMLGRSYIAAIVAPIPRSMWENKPRGPDSLYAQLFLGEAREGRAIPVSPEGEMYWNFGIPGLLVLTILYGVLIRLAYNAMWRRYPNPFAVVFYVMFITTFRFGTTSLVAFEQSIVLLAICMVTVKFFLPHRNEVLDSRILGRNTTDVPSRTGPRGLPPGGAHTGSR